MNITVITALWCPSCLLMRTRIETFRKNHPSITFSSLDYDFDEEKVLPLNVGRKLPVFIVYNQEGEELKRFKGERTLEELEHEISAL